VLQAELDRRRGDAAKAVRDLKGAVGLYPGSWPLQQAYAEALLAAGKPAEALTTLERLVACNPDNAPVYQLMADAAGKAGQRARPCAGAQSTCIAPAIWNPPFASWSWPCGSPMLDFHLASKIQVRLDEFQREERQRASPSG
jgi:predicted Zn-dependent protease